MVGGLVEQQEIGIAGQRAGQRRAPALPAGEARRIARAVEAQAVEKGGNPMWRCPVRGDEIRHGSEAAEFRLLGQTLTPQASAGSGCLRRFPPARIQIVDLPEPLAPTSATLSPRPMPRSISAKSGRPPKVSRAPRSAAMGGEAGMDH